MELEFVMVKCTLVWFTLLLSREKINSVNKIIGSIFNPLNRTDCFETLIHCMQVVLLIINHSFLFIKARPVLGKTLLTFTITFPLKVIKLHFFFLIL